MIKKALLIILAAVALTASAEFRWGPQAGLNINDYYWKQPLLKSDMRCGANAGLLGELMIPGIGFGVDFGLSVNRAGASDSSSASAASCSSISSSPSLISGASPTNCAP